MKYVPRWIVFFIDLSIVVFSLILTNYFFTNLGKHFINEYYLLANLLIITLNATSFIFFRTFTGIIRHSTLLDIVKICISTLFTFSILVFINIVLEYFNHKIYSFSGLFILSLFNFSNMFFFRLLVKNIFDKNISKLTKNKQEKVLVLGSTSKAVSLVNALVLERPQRFKIVAFIDFKNKSKSKSKTILNIPFIDLNFDIIKYKIKKYKIKGIIICDETSDSSQINKIISQFIDLNLKIYSSPIIQDFSSKNISKQIKSFKIQDLLNRKPINLNFEYNNKIITNKVILISGAAGSIGSEIVRQLVEFNPKRLILLDIAESPLHDLILEINNKIKENKLLTIIEPVICDVSRYDFLDIFFNKFKPEIIYHAAAYKHVPLMEENPTQAFLTNVIGSKNMADLAFKYRVNSFVMVSTDKAVNPSNVMGASKRMAELYIKSLSQSINNQGNNFVKFTITRFGNVLGSNGSVVPLFKKQINKGGPITLTHPEITRYFMTIPEACQLVIEAGNMGKGGEVFVFDMGQPVKIIDLAKRMIILAGYKVDQDIKIKFVGLRPGEKLYEELITDKSTTQPTHNPKIMIMKEEYIDNSIICEAIEHVYDNLNYMNHDLVVKMFKNIIPEFISMNSVYENLDI